MVGDWQITDFIEKSIDWNEVITNDNLTLRDTNRQRKAVVIE